MGKEHLVRTLQLCHLSSLGALHVTSLWIDLDRLTAWSACPSRPLVSLLGSHSPQPQGSISEGNAHSQRPLTKDHQKVLSLNHNVYCAGQ